MSDEARRDLFDALRTDLATFIHRTVQITAPGIEYLHNWHLDAIAYHLELCRKGEIKRLIITLPPRNLKSTCVSVAFVAWLLGHDPSLRIICASYAIELAAKFSRDCRAIMENLSYKRVFPGTRVDPRKNTELEFETTRKGYRYTTSIGGTLTGRGGNFIIIDDPIKPADANSDARRNAANEWFDGTLLSRLDSKKDDVIIIVMQRVHVDDLVGHVLEKGSEWVHLDLPAIAEEPQDIPIGHGLVHRREVGDLLHPEREPQEVLDRLNAEMGSTAFSAQYQQRPVPVEGNIVKWKWFQTFQIEPGHNDARIVLSFDTASKAGELNDYTVCTTWVVRDDKYYLIDLHRERLDYPSLRKWVYERISERNPHEILIEDTGSGTQLIQDLRHGPNRVHAIAIKPVGDKITRLSNVSAMIEAGQVYLPANAPWLDDLKAELLAFPNGRHDDQVDSISQFLTWMEKRKRSVIRSGTVIGAF